MAQAEGVSQADIDLFVNRSPLCESGYHGVYPHRKGWIAKAFRLQVAPVQPTARQAVIQLIKWWQDQFGKDWKQFYQARRQKAYEIKRIDDNWIVRVWICGNLTVLFSPKGKILKFPTRQEALRGFRRWKAEYFGLFLKYSDISLRRQVHQRA